MGRCEVSGANGTVRTCGGERFSSICAVAIVAFTVGALVLVNADPVASGVRPPDVFAYLLLGVYNASVVVRRKAPMAGRVSPDC